MANGFSFLTDRISILPLLGVLGAIFFLAGCGLKSSSITGESGAADRGKITIRYQYTEQDAATPPAAFHVWRATQATGPFERITSQPIEALPRPIPQQSQVLWVDRTVPIDGEAWYYLEVVDQNGRTRKATAVSRAVALLPADATP
ncbi:MAG: hypothetical protein JJU11_02830 [Candidatus Sumerlaeia bacterium]|nr:hypothetical protein [Candidatus Sumerlaeia bacterium]